MGAVIYVRISQDRDGDGAGVARQESECRQLAERRGLRVGECFVDNDVSAYGGRARPAYARLLERIREGGVSAVLAWHPDRLHRSLRDLEEFIALIDRHAVAVYTVVAGDVDLSTPIGRMIARQLGTFARYESEHRSERTAAALRQSALLGRWSGRRPYGYDLVRDEHGAPVGDGRLIIVPHEARVVREAAKRVLAGETVYAVCRDLQGRGVPSPTGTTWRTPPLRSILVSPTPAGQREYRGDVVAPGLWEPILTLEQHAALRQRLSDNRRTKGVRPARRYLLNGGLIVCGRCGVRLRTASRVGGARVYACIRSVDYDGCGRLSVRAAHVERHVFEQVVDHFGERNMRLLLGNPKAFHRELERRTLIETRMLELADMYAVGDLSRSEWVTARAGLATQLACVPDDAAHLGGLALADAEQPWRVWEALPIDSRRSLLQLVVDVVVVHPVTRPSGPRFDGSRIEVKWR